MGNWYCSLSDLKDALAITDTSDDDQLGGAIELVSRAIDNYCGRWFYPRIQTRYVTGGGSRLLLDADLLSVTTLLTDDDGDRVYETTWATTDYDLGPDGAADGAVPRPYWQIDLAPNGNYSFPSGRRGIQIVGQFGFYDQRETSSATLAEDLDASETGIDVSSGLVFSAGQTIRIDSEQMFIRSISSNTLTVYRGQNGTTAATHTSGAAIDLYVYPVIGQLAKIQAAHLFRLKDAPGGMIGGGDMGGLRIAPSFHPLVHRMLEPYRIPVIA